MAKWLQDGKLTQQSGHDGTKEWTATTLSRQIRQYCARRPGVLQEGSKECEKGKERRKKRKDELLGGGRDGIVVWQGCVGVVIGGREGKKRKERK